MKKVFAITGICAALLAVAVIELAVLFSPSLGARRAWKAQAIAEISLQVVDPMWPSNEVVRLSHLGTNNPSDSRWLSGHLILMRNGDWLTYRRGFGKY